MDIYPDLKKGKMVIWLRTEKGCHKVLLDYDPVFYARPLEGDWETLEEVYEYMDFDVERVKRKTGIYEKKKEVLRISPGEVFDPRRQADALDFFTGYGKYRFYNVDIPLDQRYLIENEVHPLSLIKKENGAWEMLDDLEDIDYIRPPLRTMHLSGSKPGSEREPVSYLKADKKELTGDEREIIEKLNRYIEKRDPDILITQGGDTYLIPYLFHRAQVNDVRLTLGRERTVHPPRDGSTYHSYGRVIYKPPRYDLKGRVHIDKSNSFLYGEGKLEGLTELSRLSKVPLQRLSRRSPGGLVNAMEIEQVLKDGYRIP